MKTSSLSPFPAILPETLQELYDNFQQQHNSEAARALIQEYFFCFKRETVNKELWRMLAGLLSDPKMPHLKKGVQRHNLLFFYEFTLIFMEAAELLVKEEQ